MKEIHTHSDIEQIKLGEVIWIDGRRVIFHKAVWNTCNNCAFNMVVQRPNGAFTKCTMPFMCKDGYSFEEIKEGGL